MIFLRSLTLYSSVPYLLPTPFPIEHLLSPRDLRHIQLLYGMGGLSYGNVSARKDEEQFWMSASGVNKAISRQNVLPIQGYNASVR